MLCIFQNVYCRIFLLCCPWSKPKQHCFPRLHVWLPHPDWESPPPPRWYLTCKKIWFSKRRINTITRKPHPPPTREPVYLLGSPCWCLPWQWAAPPTAPPRPDPPARNWSGPPPRGEGCPPKKSPQDCGDRFPLWTTPGEKRRGEIIKRDSRTLRGERNSICIKQCKYSCLSDKTECVILLWALTRSKNN